MAYSSVRVQFEIGHEASIRTKYTPEGFTHDWEVFVRGADNTDIQYFVEKVVFHLHETFPKPKRVIKDPPYIVKESGYAGFVLPIDVYLKNKEEPKKISFQYDLTLQPSGPPISRVLREPRLFQNPSEDFRRKLIRGGGVGVDTPSENSSDDFKSGSAGNKTKLTDSSIKKHKPELVQNDSFSELFGTPIRRVDPKKLPELPKKLPETDSSKDKKPSKHGSYKNEKEILKEKTKHSEKERSKERDRSKEKSLKRPSTPPAPLPQVVKPKDEHKKHEDKEKKKEEYEDKKKRKEEKDRKDKPKDVTKDLEKSVEKEHKKEKKDPKDLDYLKKLNSIKSQELKPNGEKLNEIIEKEKPEKEKHKHRHKKKEKEKTRDKEKHKKGKDKSDKESKEREKDKSGKKKHEELREKEDKIKRKSRSPSPFPVQERPKKGPLNALLDELGSSGSGSPLSEDEDPVPPFKPASKPSAKIVPEARPQPVSKINSKLKSTNVNVPIESRADKEVDKPSKVLDEVSLLKIKKDKSSSKKSKKLDKSSDKKKSKEEHRGRSVSSEREDEDTEKDRMIVKEDREPSEKEVPEEEKPKPRKDKENRKGKREKSEEDHVKAKKVATLENNVEKTARAVEVSDSPEETLRPDKFSKEYIAQLKDLQHRIMTLEDGEELQNIVKVIAETGQYEITKKTFDFDLCALDSETVKRLQELFSHT